MTEFLSTTADKFTFRVATDRLYHPEGLWVLAVGAARVRIGVTDYLAQHSGDVAFVTVPRVGTRVAAGAELAELETMKVNLSLPAPVPGVVVEANPALAATPEQVNLDPYGAGWLAVVDVDDWDAVRGGLLAPDAYLAVMRRQVDEELGQP